MAKSYIAAKRRGLGWNHSVEQLCVCEERSWFLTKVVVVNDCAHTTANLVPFLQDDFEIDMLLRTRGLWSKTFGLMNRIRKSKADVYHVNYALQDAWLVQKLKSLDVLWCHGSDVRKTQYSRLYGWIVKSNVKNAKCVLYANPDSPQHLKARPDAEYLAIPVNTDTFPLKTNYNNPPKALYMPKKTDTYNSQFTEICKKAGVPLSILERKFSYEKMPDLLAGYDILVDTFAIAGNSTLGIEAMSTGLAMVDYRDWGNLQNRMETLREVEQVKREGQQNREFVLKTHDAKVVAKQLANKWQSCR